MSALLDRIVVPVATVEDARNTAAALSRSLAGEVGTVLGVHVIEKGQGAVDKAPLAAREEEAKRVLEAFVDALEANGFDVETRVLYGPDVPETVRDAVLDAGATAIVFCPRPAGTITRLLTGDRARALLETSPVPVISLPVEEARGS